MTQRNGQTTLFEDAPSFTNRSTNAVTFRGKMNLPIHRWYRLTPSFSPQLANDIADCFGLTSGDNVLDPFSGVGTVPLCMKYRGIPACSIELNPFLHFVSTVKTRTYTNVEAIEACFSEFLEKFATGVKQIPADADATIYLREHQAFVPPIHKAHRWWSPGNLMQITCLRRLMLAHETEPELRDLLRMGALGILISVSNAKHNHVSLTFADDPLPRLNVVAVLQQKYQEMVRDLRAVSDLPHAPVKIYQGNSKQVSSVLPGTSKISAIITSPPYPNRFSYARETRPQLFFFDFIRDAAAVGQLETDSIGGTWGKATSILAGGVEPVNDLISTLLRPYTGNIKGECTLMAAYVTKYFNDLFLHAQEISMVCRESTQLAYVIGNSKFFGHPLPSDEILAAIFCNFGFRLDRIDRMRKRQSKSGLYEAVVFMSR